MVIQIHTLLGAQDDEAGAACVDDLQWNNAAIVELRVDVGPILDGAAPASSHMREHGPIGGHDHAKPDLAGTLIGPASDLPETRISTTADRQRVSCRSDERQRAIVFTNRSLQILHDG